MEATMMGKGAMFDQTFDASEFNEIFDEIEHMATVRADPCGAFDGAAKTTCEKCSGIGKSNQTRVFVVVVCCCCCGCPSDITFRFCIFLHFIRMFLVVGRPALEKGNGQTREAAKKVLTDDRAVKEGVKHTKELAAKDLTDAQDAREVARQAAELLRVQAKARWDQAEARRDQADADEMAANQLLDQKTTERDDASAGLTSCDQSQQEPTCVNVDTEVNPETQAQAGRKDTIGEGCDWYAGVTHDVHMGYAMPHKDSCGTTITILVLLLMLRNLFTPPPILLHLLPPTPPPPPPKVPPVTDTCSTPKYLLFHYQVIMIMRIVVLWPVLIVVLVAEEKKHHQQQHFARTGLRLIQPTPSRLYTPIWLLVIMHKLMFCKPNGLFTTSI
jgi:hypothetical protein